MEARQDRRVRRTRAALIDAFNHLVLQRGKGKIRVADIVEKANVGRSTFYEHFAGAEAIQMEALARPLAVLADAAAGKGDPARLEALLAHFWENRRLARDTFSGRAGEQAARLLADLVEARLRDSGTDFEIPLRLAALQLAAAALAPVRGWVLAEAPCTAEILARSLCRSGRELAAGLGRRE
jgi:AcrR family transcriptional regulator